MQPDTTLPKIPKVKQWIGLLTQAGTAAPTAVVIKNTLGGTIVWTRFAQGRYRGTLTGQFGTLKTIAFITNTIQRTANYVIFTDDDTVYIDTGDNTANEDGFLENTPLEINVYT